MAAAQTAPAADEGAATVTEQAPVRPARRAARAKGTAALLAAVGSGVILLTIGRGWAHGDVTSPITFRVTATGSQLTGVPYALGLAGLAGALALFAVRRIGRYLVGAVLVLAGAGTVYAVADRLSRLDDGAAHPGRRPGPRLGRAHQRRRQHPVALSDDPRRRAAVPRRRLHTAARPRLVRTRQPLRGARHRAVRRREAGRRSDVP